MFLDFGIWRYQLVWLPIVTAGFLVVSNNAATATAWLLPSPASPFRSLWRPINLGHRTVGGRTKYNRLQQQFVVRNDATIDIPILYESDRLLIINKPPGIAHHNDRINDDDSDDDEELSSSAMGIVNLVRTQRNGERLWGVHRLDRVTSGILVMAKDAAMAQALTSQFAKTTTTITTTTTQGGGIQKVYCGISARRPTKKKQGWVQGGMVRSRDKSWKLTRDTPSSKTTSPSAKRNTANFAKTRFFTAPILSNNGDKLTLLLFRPYTGKTHQLRVAAKAMGLPLLGDPTYKHGKGRQNDGEDDGEHVTFSSSRTYLHASGILLPPMLDMNEPLAVWCPPPFDDVMGPKSVDAISNLMRKDCDVSEIVQAMEDSLLAVE